MATLFDQLVTELATRLEGVHETPFLSYANDPVGFAENVLGVKLWEKQKTILESVRDNKYTASSAALNVGKSFSAACVALWWINTRPNSKVVATAPPPERQVRDILFAEIRKLQKQCLERGVPLVGGDPKTMAIDVADDWWIHGFTIPQAGTDDIKVAKFQGHHCPGGVLVIGDEANGIPAVIYEAFDNILSAANCRILLLSNPLVPSGPFWNALRGDTYNTISISAFEHPNVATGEVSILGAIDRYTTDERIQKFTRVVEAKDFDGDEHIFEVPWTGEKRVVSNPIFFYKVLGMFPTEPEGSLIPPSVFQRARRNWDVLMEEANREGHSLPVDLPLPDCGLDVAEFGTDSNAFAARYDHFLAPFLRWGGMDVTVVAEWGMRYARRVKANRVNVDAIGVGAGVAPLMRKDDINAFGVKVSWSATRDADEYEFYRLRDQLGWSARQWFQRPDAAVPPDEDFEADMYAYMYENTRSGIRITSKNKLRGKIGGRSPDAGDAFFLTFYHGGEGNRPEVGVESMVISRGGGRVPTGIGHRRGVL